MVSEQYSDGYVGGRTLSWNKVSVGVLDGLWSIVRGVLTLHVTHVEAGDGICAVQCPRCGPLS